LAEVRILRQGLPGKVVLTRAKIVQPAIESRIEEPGVGYIKITTLAEGKAAEVKTAVSDLVAKGAQKIVLDLRGCANGKLQEGVAVANLFAGSGTIARVLGKGDKETATFSADASKVVFNGPLAVVIDRSTAGPAEVIAAAVRDQKRGELVGERTFGTGSDQQLFKLSDEGALLITTAKYAPAAGKAFMEEPVTPTVKVDRPVEAEVILPDGEDDQDTEDKPPQLQLTPSKPAQPVEDIQLKKAFEVIKQTPVKAQAAPKRAAMKAPLPSGAVYEARITT
jgi:carboxyl-terminal processing protease